MKALRTVAFASGLSVLALAAVSCAYHAVPTRTLTGEMVVTDLSASRFRMIGHDGSFAAPAGTQMQALDGRNVQVDMTSSGHVTQITELPGHGDPITHGWGTARGELVVRDVTTGRFTFAGDNQTYIAPSAINIAPYAGKVVEVRLDEGGRVTDMHIVSSLERSSLPHSGGSCSYGDQTYSAGAAICQSGTQYRCDASQWQSLGIACQVSDTRDLNVPARLARACVVGDSTVANGSGICRDGTTFRCNDGAWIDSRTACR